MKFFKKSAKLWIILLVASLMTLTLSACGEDDAEFELRLAHFFPGTHPAETDFVKVWSDLIFEATDGRVKIVSYPGGTLLSADDTYEGVVEGTADIGLSCFAYTRGRFPVLEAFELPGVIYQNSKVASMVAWEGIKELNPQEVQDTHLLMVIATGPGDLATKTPVRTLEDLRGMEIRATGISAKTLELLGATPIGMAQSEAYEALSRGIVKGNLIPIEVLRGWNQAEVTDYLTLTPFLYNTLFFVTMNLESWNALPDDLKDIITEVTETFHLEQGIGLWDRQNEAAFDFAVTDHGMQVIELDEEEAQRWIQKVMPIQDEYRDNIRRLNIDMDALSVINRLADHYNAVYAE